MLEVASRTGGKAMLDPARIERALDNLVLNAMQNTPPGGRVILGAARRGSALVLSVADTGRGVPEVIRANLFEPFVTGRPEGTGSASPWYARRPWPMAAPSARCAGRTAPPSRSSCRKGGRPAS